MAEEKTATIELERTYNIPLRKEFQKSPKYKRSKKAVSAVRKFLMKHMKTEKVKVGKYLNLQIWKDGIKNPPHHVKVVAKKDSDGIVFAELEGAPEEKVEKKEEKKKEEKPEAKKEKEEKKETKEEKPETKEKKTEVKEEKPKAEEKKAEVKKEKPKVEEKEEKPKEVKEKKAKPKKESTEKKSIKKKNN